MPQSLGHSVSLVSALIIGDAAIATGLMSTPVIFVASVTAIAVFVTPSFVRACYAAASGCGAGCRSCRAGGPCRGAFLQFCSAFPAQPACRCHIWRRIRSRSGPWEEDGIIRRNYRRLSAHDFNIWQKREENDAKTERLFCSRAGTERVDSCAGRRNADRYLSAWDDHSWSGSGSLLTCISGVFLPAGSGQPCSGSGCFRRSMVSGRVVWNRNAGPEHLPAGVPLHGADRPAAAFALGRVVYSAFRLGCSGTGAVVVRAAGWAGLSDRACRADGLGAPADGRCCMQLARWPRVPLYAGICSGRFLQVMKSRAACPGCHGSPFWHRRVLLPDCLVFGQRISRHRSCCGHGAADVFSRMDALLLLIWLTSRDLPHRLSLRGSAYRVAARGEGNER